MSLCEAVHGTAAMARVGAPWPAMRSSPERGKRRKEEGERGCRCGAPWGGGGLQEGGHGGSACCSGLLGSVRERRREGKDKKEKRKKKSRQKREKWENFVNIEISEKI
jgi:hypothetical protein